MVIDRVLLLIEVVIDQHSHLFELLSLLRTRRIVVVTGVKFLPIQEV